MNDPRFLTIFSIVFILLGLYNLYAGNKRIREAQARGQEIRWYKQIAVLTGIEYILLALVFLLSVSIRTGFLPKSLNSIILPFYLIVLLSAAVLAGLVIRQALRNARQMRPTAPGVTTQRAEMSSVNGIGTNGVDERQRKDLIEHRRERRRKAAEARRRRAGKA